MRSAAVKRKAALYFTFQQNDADGDWMEKQMLVPEDLESGDFFGLSVSASGDRVLIGAPAYQRQDAPGAAYVYKYDEGSGMWMQEAKAR